MEEKADHLRPVETIGWLRCDVRQKGDLPRQAGLGVGPAGVIELREDLPAELLDDLAGFDRIWLLSWLDRAQGWHARVRPPRGEGKRGLLATRAPHRPNPIGLSCVRLVSIAGRRIEIADHDLLDGTPIIDIKPYLPYADAHPDASVGWAEDGWKLYEVAFEEEAREAFDWLAGRGVPLEERALPTLALRPSPRRGHRVRPREGVEGGYSWSWRSWRIDYRLDVPNGIVIVEAVRSGRASGETLGAWDGPLDGIDLHRDFVERKVRDAGDSL